MGRAVAGFWHGGALPPLDIACLMTFVAHGYDVTVYGYDPIAGLPAEIAQGDAAAIVDRKYLRSFVVLGKPSLSHFSDLFRYELFRKTDAAWIDTDLLCLRAFDIPATGNFFAKETPAGINGAIMRIDSQDGRLDRVRDLCLGFADGQEFTWGATGPGLVTQVYGDEALASAHPIHAFYPVHWNDWWKPFLAAERDWCEERCADADALHLWNNIVEKGGYWKALAPPAGSFLHSRLDRAGLLPLFKETLPEGVMRHLADNYVNLRTGAHLRLAELTTMTLDRASSLVRKRLSGTAAVAS